MNKLTVEGIVVKFENSSGESLRFEQPLAVKDMKREHDGSDDKKGGCNALSLNLLAFLFLPLWLLAGKAIKAG